MITFLQFFLESSDIERRFLEVPPKSLGMFNSMVRLPMTAPYGFWMDKHGNYIPVLRLGHHSDIAEELLKKAGIHPIPDSVYDFLLRLGWVRIIVSKGQQKIFWETYPGEFPTSYQKRNMEFMKDFYDLKSVEMG
jgi:hypothetical protein